MAFIGGDTIEITFNHPTVGTGTIYPKSGEDSTIDVGGFRSEDDTNMIAGNADMIDKLNRVRWSYEIVIAWDQNDENELQKLADIARSPEQADFTFSLVNGVTWGGKGKPVGDLQGNGNASTASIKFSGGGELVKIE